MEVTTIIPIYNSNKFLSKAIDSALLQKECKEIILIDDASEDGSLAVCQEYIKKDKRIRLFVNKVNYGPAQARNIGINNASCPFISFLDADDFYLPNRFMKTSLFLKQHKDADGIYEGLGVYYYTPEMKDRHIERIGTENTMLKNQVNPDKLFSTLIKGGLGHIHLNGLTLKRSVIKKEDFFDKRIRLGEDTDFIWNLASKYRLYGGDVNDIVAMRGVHRQNSVFLRKDKIYFDHILYSKWLKKTSNPVISKEDRWVIVKNYINKKMTYVPYVKFFPQLIKGTYFLVIIIRHPQVAQKLLFN